MVTVFQRIGEETHGLRECGAAQLIPFPDPITEPEGTDTAPALVKSGFRVDIPEGKISVVVWSSGHRVGICACSLMPSRSYNSHGRRASSASTRPSRDLLTFSDGGEIIEHPRELRIAAKRLAQAQRGHRKQLTARIHERVSNKRKDRNHKLSRTLVAENKIICFLKDNHRAIAKRFGKSVCDSAHGGLRT